jgi:hypothetical protein
MPDPTPRQEALTYLTELETALRGIPPETRNGILSGVREELESLTGSDASRRIQELGDPQFIASEARAEAATGAPGKHEARWFSVVAALLVMVGGFVIPLLGALAGFVMVWFSGTWSRKEKWIATLTPVAVALLLAIAGITSSLWQVPQAQPANGETPNPLIPVAYDLITTGVLLVLVVQIGVGVWLLVRANRTNSGERL